MSIMDKLEKSLGRFAIPGLVAILAIVQAGAWVLMQSQPNLIKVLLLDPMAVRQGELWRLVTWVFVNPRSSVIWLFFQVMLMFLMSHALDSAWGAFRTNLYVFGGIFFVSAGVMLFGDSNALAIGSYLYTTIMLAFAVFHPDFELYLFMVLPLKMRYVALLLAGRLLFDFIQYESSRLVIFLSLLNFGIAFGGQFLKNLRQGAKVSSRRKRFETAQQPDTPVLHQCHSCGKTDAQDPTLDFRVGVDGNDYCNNCRQNLQTSKP